MFTQDEIENRFGHHKATLEGENATLPKHTALRAHYTSFASLLDSLLPDGREKELAMTSLETASMWSHKSVATQAPLAVDEESPEEEAARLDGEAFDRNGE